jgi:hypothetical protein
VTLDKIGRPPARTWVLAAVELLAAIAVARLIVWTDREPATGPRHHGMPGMAERGTPVAHWGRLEYAAIAVAVIGFAWWLVRRHTAAAVLAAAGLTVLAASPGVRVLAPQSHLIAMVALELLLVIAPLLVLAAVPRGHRARFGPVRRWGAWSALAVAAALAYAALLITIHLPAVHHRAAALGVVPVWVAMVALAVGIGYWFVVLRSTGLVPTAVRRGVLLGAQEVAAFIGLLSLFGAWSSAMHQSPLGLSAAWDQRLGGVFMMAACATVAVPILRKLRGGD